VPSSDLVGLVLKLADVVMEGIEGDEAHTAVFDGAQAA
jgi:hypothetical protein